MSQRDPQTVFLVDDDEHVRSSIVRGLTARGYAVEAYASGHTFFEAVSNKATGCLILDQGLPNMTGLEVQREMRDRGYDLPIIFITGHGSVDQSVQAMRLGAINFLEKPFRRGILVENIEIALATWTKANG